MLWAVCLRRLNGSVTVARSDRGDEKVKRGVGWKTTPAGHGLVGLMIDANLHELLRFDTIAEIRATSALAIGDTEHW
jgi:hypothetical protein